MSDRDEKTSEQEWIGTYDEYPVLLSSQETQEKTPVLIHQTIISIQIQNPIRGT